MSARRFEVSLPADVVDIIDSKLRSGLYASVSEALSDGIRSLLDRDAAGERWLRDDVLAGHAEYLADPSKAVPAEQILDRIKNRRNAEPLKS